MCVYVCVCAHTVKEREGGNMHVRKKRECGVELMLVEEEVIHESCNMW